MVAFIVSILILVALVAAAMAYAPKRPVGTPITWGEAMVAATFVFFVLFWAYGVVPHQWLTWADSELGWRPDAIVFGPGGQGISIGSTRLLPGLETFPMRIHKQVFRDVIATLLYVVLLGFNIWIWAWWQNRGKRAEAAPEPTSAYGRPLVKQS